MAKILLIEDNLANRKLAARVLEPHGHELLVATDGEQGIQTAVETVPDLVLIDIGLPDIDGHTVVTLLKQVSDLEHTILVAITAWPEDLARDVVERYGYDGIIYKPIDVKRFPDQIAGYLTRKRAE